VLYLDNNRLSGAPHRLRGVRLLGLAGNQITEFPVSASKVEELSLAHNPLLAGKQVRDQAEESVLFFRRY
jgi:hypothetical protein